jgi:hypothetical protein
LANLLRNPAGWWPQHPEAEFYFFFDRPYDEQFIFGPNVKPVVLFPPARHPFLFYIWFEISVARALKEIQARRFPFHRWPEYLENQGAARNCNPRPGF